MEGPALGIAMPRSRPAVEVLSGQAPEAVREIEGDFAMLESGRAAVRVWACDAPAVVLGASRDAAAEVHAGDCERLGVAVLRRASGGGTVMIGRGTVQYAFVLPSEEHGSRSLESVKRFCNGLVREALEAAGAVATLESDAWGDLKCGDVKVGGVALARRRHATLLHGTLLIDADLELVASVLGHPAREPDYRRRRPHRDFLMNLGRIDAVAFEAALARAMRKTRNQPI